MDVEGKLKAEVTIPQQVDGYQNMAVRIQPKGVTPNAFKGSSSGLAWISDRGIRE
jgi:hypothetical protein